MTVSATPNGVKRDIGLALSLSGAALDQGLEHWLSPVISGSFDSVWSLENPLSDQAEPLVWLAAAAMLAPEATVGTAALIAPTRHPILLARQLASLDRMTGGRLNVGLTIGRRQTDYELAGTDYTKRGRILDETLKTLRAVWLDAPLDVTNPFWELQSTASIGIKPASRSGPPLLVGGHADVALRRAVTLGDGYLAGATSGPAHALATHARLLSLLDEHEREPATFRFVTNLFVVVDTSQAAAIATANDIFHGRHGGPPPYDPALVVAGGPAHQIAETAGELLSAGYSGVNLVPVAMTIDEVNKVAEVADLVRRS